MNIFKKFKQGRKIQNRIKDTSSPTSLLSPSNKHNQRSQSLVRPENTHTYITPISSLLTTNRIKAVLYAVF